MNMNRNLYDLMVKLRWMLYYLKLNDCPSIEEHYGRYVERHLEGNYE